MKKRFNTKIILLGIVILFSSSPFKIAAQDTRYSLDYGKVRAVKTITVNQKVPFAIAANRVDGIMIETSPLTGVKTGHKIDAKQLALVFADQNYPLSQSSVLIDLTDFKSNSVIPRLALELNPEDLADHYSGTITLTPWSNNGQEKQWKTPVTVELSVTVKPWAKLICQSTTIALEKNVYSGLTLKSVESLQLKVASNSTWLLYCYLDSARSPITPVIKLTTSNTTHVKLLPLTKAITNLRQNLAVGAATTTNGLNACELQASFAIDDFAQYPANNYTLPLHFAVELWNGETI